MEATPETAGPRAWIDKLTFSDGTAVSLKDDDIVVLVGPNNSGKSRALRDIQEGAKVNALPEGVVVTSLDLKAEGDASALEEWLERNSRKSTRNPTDPTYTRLGANVTRSQARSFWSSQEGGLNQLANFFVYLLTTDERLSTSNPAPNIALTTDPLTHPIHYMQINELTEAKISSYFREAFGEDLVVHRNAGSKVPLHCGRKPVPGDGEDRVSVGYLEKLEKLPTLHTQGDGMRGFVGVILHTMAVDRTVVLIDEPEAFLHPPQARLLGQMIVKETPGRRQLFLATHSGDFLRGLLDQNSSRVRVLRIQRDGAVNPVRELDSDGIERVWGDPILRYSNVLDGVFHNKVVLCESDSDCRFYAAVMDAMLDEAGDARREHIMFLHCGGKARMPVVVESLSNLDVPVRVITDFDILNDENPLRRIVETLGGDWTTVSGMWSKVYEAVQEKKPEMSTEEIRAEVGKILDSVEESILPSQAKTEIQKLLKRSSPWSTAKTVGKAFVPSGVAATALGDLLAKLEGLGLYVVPIGELEGFARTVPGHGPKWVNQVLEKDLANDTELRDARDFLARVLA